MRDFDRVFGDVGFKVGPRTGKNKRTKEQKEWFVVRNFLKTAVPADLFRLPLSVEQVPPPEPDFLLRNVGCVVRMEITEATDESDQREMTEIEKSGEHAVLLGELGGRFKGGASEPGYEWSSDIIAAIERKAVKSIAAQSGSKGHLVIYPNSNAAFLLTEFEDECRAFEIFRADVAARQRIAQAGNYFFVHILGSEAVFVDVLGKPRILERN
jgi:hypothetical protein